MWHMHIGVRDGGSGSGSGVGGRGVGGGGQLTPQHSDRYDNYSGKRQYICLTNRVTERNKYPST